MSSQPLSPLVIRGLRILRLNVEESHHAATQALGSSQLNRLFFVNAHCFNVAQSDTLYFKALQHAEMVFNDGAGLELAGKLFAQPFPSNLNGTDWIPDFFSRLNAMRPGTKVFLLGAKPEVMTRMAEVFQDKWPHLNLVGTQHGYYGADQNALGSILAAKPEVLLVAMGVPKQEIFLHTHFAALEAGGLKLAIAGGAIVDFLTGSVPRAPKWVRQLRMEWVWRLAIEPKRLFKRYIFGNFLFVWHILVARYVRTQSKKERRKAAH